MKDGADRTSISDNSSETLVAERPSGPSEECLGLAVPPLRIEIDFDYYLSFLKDENLPEGRKRELIRELVGIVNGFVALGYNVHPFQQAKRSCGEISSDGSAATDGQSMMLGSSHSRLIREFVRRSGKLSRAGEKGAVNG